MRYLRFFVATLTALFTLAGRASWVSAAPVDEVIAGAKKEGVIEFYGASTLTPQGAQALGKAFNKRYGLDIKLNYSPAGSYTRDIGKVVSRAATGVPPEWDVMLVTDAHHGRLWLRKLQETFDYRKLGVDPKLIHYDNGAVSFATQFNLPAYNKKILPAKDVPKSWDDLLDPKWKGGKLGVIHSTHHWARLAVGPWGEERTTEFVKKLAAQRPFLGRPGEMYSRLLLGEVVLSATLQNSFIFRAKKKGAPLVHVEGIEPVIAPQYHAGVPKGALHPNLGYLFTAFMTTPEAQKIWEKYTGHTSALVPGTTAYKYAQGKQVVYMTQDMAKTVSKLSRKYAKILGFKK
ncbi:MAG: ABC transporter substrate-binding protein [Candidatus Binatia bacterium]